MFMGHRDRTCEIENKTEEFNQSAMQSREEIENVEQSLHSSEESSRLSDGSSKERRWRRMFKRTAAENFPNMKKEDASLKLEGIMECEAM